GAGGELHVAEIDRQVTERGDRVDADRNASTRTHRLQRGGVVEHTGRRLELHEPQPGRRIGVEAPLDGSEIERTAPRRPHVAEPEREAARMIDEPIAELAVAENQTAPAVQ